MDVRFILLTDLYKQIAAGVIFHYVHTTINDPPNKQYQNSDRKLISMIFDCTIVDKGNVQITSSVTECHQYVSAKNVTITKFYTT